MAIALGLLLAIHGLIHLLGFVHAFKLAEIPQFTGATLVALPEVWTRAIGLTWMLTCAVLVTAGALLLLRAGSWWLFAAAGLSLSQLLVIYAWPDAKAGTLANLVLVIPVIVAWADAGFQRATDAQVHALFSRSSQANTPAVTREAIAPLPAPVRRWLEGSGIVGRRVPRTVRLRQRGLMRLSAEQAEIPATAEQYFRVDEPEFIWRVRVRVMKFLPVAGRDSYVDGRGRMSIALASLIPVVEVADEKIDQGALLRFLGETVWFPAAALSPYIHWEPLDERSARATMTHNGVSGAAVFSFDEHGRFIRLTADRYFGGGADAKLERWEIEAQEWRTMAGCRQVPVRGEVRWKLAKGDFTFYRWELTELEYDLAVPSRG